LCDFGIAEIGRNVVSVQQNTIAILTLRQNDIGSGGKSDQSRLIVRRYVGTEGLEGKGAVHGAALQVQQTKAESNLARDRAFTRACRAVDGDDRAALGGCGICRVHWLAHPRFLALA
jgi:hypothetical protein